MEEVKVLSTEEFRKMQLLQLDMLAELDRICRKHNIKYSIFCGTLLGAVRHKGYIPWDDDADVAMLRSEYEKFKKVINELNPEICYFQDYETDLDYRWGYGKLRRTGTTYIRAGQEHLKCKNGVFIDIFPLDDIPKIIPLQVLQDLKYYILRKILWSEVGKYCNEGMKKICYRFLSHIPTKYVFKQIEKKCMKKNNSTRCVRTLLFPAFGKLYIKNPISKRYGMPKEWFLDLVEYEFEGIKLFGTRKYDEILKYIYDDYMVLPPEEDRVQHAPVSSYNF